jgi:hypothetical protein
MAHGVGIPPQLAADVAAGKVVYDGKAAADCFAERSGDACGTSARRYGSSATRCSQIFTGAVALGGACSSSNQCKDGGCTGNAPCQEGMCCPGTCMPFTISLEQPVGASCMTTDWCVDTAYCDNEANMSAPGTCRTFVPLGGACGPGISCDPRTWCADGKCRAFTPRGGDCSSIPCDDNLHDRCDPTTQKCVARAANGAACTASDECAFYGYCDPVTHTCGSNAALGEECGNNTGRGCMPELVCKTGVCVKFEYPPTCT